MSELNKAQIRRQIEEAWNNGDLLVTHETHHADATIHDTGHSQHKNVDTHKDLVTAYRTAFPDQHIRIDHMIVEGDMVAGRLTGTGTQDGELMGIPPSHKPVTLSANFIVRFKEGKIHEAWVEWDRLSLLQQLGVLPPNMSQLA